MTKTFVVVTRAVLIVGIVLAGVTSVLSYLAAVSAEQGPVSPKAHKREFHLAASIMNFVSKIF